MRHSTPIADSMRPLVAGQYSEELADILEQIKQLEIANEELEDDLIVVRRRNAMLRKMLAEKPS